MIHPQFGIRRPPSSDERAHHTTGCAVGQVQACDQSEDRRSARTPCDADPSVAVDGASVPSNQLFFDPPACRVITAVGPPDLATGKRPPIYIKEDAPWSAVRNAAHSYGFAAFDLDPGYGPGGFTTIKVTYYDVVGPSGALAPFETFTLRRPRRDQA